MQRKEYKFGRDAREAIKEVSEHIGDTLGKTLGPAGRDYQTPEGITNDGKTILSHIRFADECKDNVALAFHEIANRQDIVAGDGTTTSVVVGTKLGSDLVDIVPDLDSPQPGQQSVMDISRQLEEETKQAIAILETKKIDVTTLEQLEQVAFTSMQDAESAQLIAKTIFDAGKDSFTALDEGFSGKLEAELQPGIELPVQVAAPFMFNKSNTEAMYENVPVLVVNHLFEDYREFSPFMSTVVDFLNSNQAAKFPAIVIVAKQFSIPFVQAVARVNLQSPIKLLCLSNSYLADDVFGDIAAFTDADYVDTHPKGGKKITDVKFTQCGMVAKVIATPKGAVFFGGKGTGLTDGETTRVQSRIMEIRQQLEGEKDSKKREAMERRISEFQGGKATLYVDAKTAAEKYYLKLKVQDCMNSCKTALSGGMVKGGGITLKEVAEELGTASLLYNALQEPYKRIQRNAGGSLEIGDGVFDSFIVAKAGIENAVSVVKTLIRIEGVIADTPPSLVEELKTVINA